MNANTRAHDLVAVRKTGPDSHGLVAVCRLSPGTELFSFVDFPRLSARTRYSLQIAEATHLGSSPQGGIDDYLNHGCSPNAHLDLSTLSIRVWREIRPGENVRINYCATEDELFESFRCDCGSAECYGVVAGYRFLDRDQRGRLSALVSPWLKEKYGV